MTETTTTNGTPSRIDGFLEAIRQDFHDDGLRHILADYLDEQGPTPVTAGDLPEWLRLRFPRDRPVIFLDPWAKPYAMASAVRDAIKEYLQRTGPRHLGSLLYHDGSTTIGGHLCYVSEPYGTEEEAIRYFRGLAQGLGCVDAFARQSWHSQQYPAAKGCVRMLLFPPMAGLKPEEAEEAKEVERRKRWKRWRFFGWVFADGKWGPAARVFANGKWEYVSKGQRYVQTCIDQLRRAIDRRDLGEWACAITTTDKPPDYIPHYPYHTHHE
jgi:uncharacterized protein (TIGR02996 family)